MNSKRRILSIDGGGIRGIIPAQILGALEQKLAHLSGNGDAKIGDYFDLVAGTSTGGLLACLVLTPGKTGARPRFSAAELIDLYVENGEDIFYASFWQRLSSLNSWADEKYQADALERIIEEKVGDLRLSQLLKPCLITSYNLKTRRATFFTQHDIAAKGKFDFPVKNVARATSAAPTYFEAAVSDEDSAALIDGGVFANNPAMCAFVEAHKFNKTLTAADVIMLSLGTGQRKKPYSHEQVKDWGRVRWALPLLDVLMSSSAETVDYQLKQIFTAACCANQYLRIQPRLDDASTDLDDVSPENIQRLLALGREAAAANDEALTRLAELLIAESDGFSPMQDSTVAQAADVVMA